MGAWLFLHGFCIFFLSFLHGDFVANTGNGATLMAQLAAISMVFAGGLLWLL